MSALELQQCTARLFADQSFLQTFVDNPQRALRDYRLTKKERRLLLKLDRHGLLAFAGILEKNRFRAIEFAAPLSVKLLGRRLRSLYRRFVQLSPSGSRSYQEEVQRFSAFAQDVLRSENRIPAVALDLFRYEVALYLTAYDEAHHHVPRKRLPKRWRAARFFASPAVYVGRFTSDPIRTSRQVSQGRALDVRKREIRLVFQKIEGRNAAKVFRVSDDVVRLLEFCRSGPRGGEIQQAFPDASVSQLQRTLRNLADKKLFYSP